MMSERKEREKFSEFVCNNDEGVPTYYKMRMLEKVTYGFWIPAISGWFWPCDKDQDELHRMFTQATELKLDTTPITLKRSWSDVTPEDEPAVEEHPATEKEQEDLDWWG